MNKSSFDSVISRINKVQQKGSFTKSGGSLFAVIL